MISRDFEWVIMPLDLKWIQNIFLNSIFPYLWLLLRMCVTRVPRDFIVCKNKRMRVFKGVRISWKKITLIFLTRTISLEHRGPEWSIIKNKLKKKHQGSKFSKIQKIFRIIPYPSVRVNVGKWNLRTPSYTMYSLY